MDADKLARRIRAFRKLKQLTQKEFADMLSISLTTLGEMERGNRRIQRDKLAEIAHVLQIPLEEIEHV
jgi:transcriptional regulator with XRE-family HTH domain